MLTDEIKIRVKAGRGGDGVVAFSKVKMELGPTGGRGGNGGNIYVRGVANLSALNRYKHKKEYLAEDGKKGRVDRSDGREGKDLILDVPVGSLVSNLDTGENQDILKVGQKILVARGGLGGRGNFHFRSSRNTSPKEAEEGKPGEEFNIVIELRLIADIGLVGLPSAGKTSLLNELTKAGAKVGAYHFTTLEPNLGVMEDGIILADIPGLIEGASSGRGLGIKFLRHIRRTKALIHCISLESEDPKEDYLTIRKELETYSKDLIKKKEIVFLTKSDLVSPEFVRKMTGEMKKKNPETYAVSVHDWEALEKMIRIIEKMASMG